jgi:hypothetical protein
MKLHFALAVAALMASASVASAHEAHPAHMRGVHPARSCIPWPQCEGGFTPVNVGPLPFPGPNPSPPAPTGVVTSLIKDKTNVLAQLQAADSMDRQIIPRSSPPEMWDPIGHMCIAGIGTEGQPGYVPGLAKWVEGLTVPPTPPAAPGGAQGPIIAFTQARLAVIAGLRVTSSLQTQGIPLDLRQSCGGLLADINNQIITAAAQVAAFAKLFAILVPK